MSGLLFDLQGNRKYLTARERLSFATAATATGGLIGVFCLTLALTGARISEVLALTPDRIDIADEAIVIRTLRQREKLVFRAIPVPSDLVLLLSNLPASPNGRIFPWGWTLAWKFVKAMMRNAGIAEALKLAVTKTCAEIADLLG